MDSIQAQGGGGVIHRAADTFRGIAFKAYSIVLRQVLEEHSHDYMQIWYVMNGCCSHIVGGASHRLARGCLFTVPPFVSHRIVPENGGRVEILGCEFLESFVAANISDESRKESLFDFTCLEPFLASLRTERPRFRLRGAGPLAVEQLMGDMIREFTEERDYYEISIKADLLKLLTIIAREYEEIWPGAPDRPMERHRRAVEAAREYIDAHYAEGLRIEDVCRRATMSHTYFSLLFKQATGRTFTEYVNNLRVHRSMVLLAETGLSISEICHSAGFNESAYFDKVFRKETGLSPRQYRAIAKRPPPG